MEKQFVVVFAVLLAACSMDKAPIAGRTDSIPGVFTDGGGSFVDGMIQTDGSLPVSDAAPQDGSQADAMTALTDAGGNLTDAGGQDAMVDATVPTDSGSDATITPVPECPGSGPGTKCEGQERFACVLGQWEAQEVCDHVCQAGACVGVCDPGDKDCSGQNPRTCNSNGQWVQGLACSFVCSAGDCTGACVPGDRDCQGLVPRSCNASGQWVQETQCSLYCGGEGVCSGVCTPGDRDCSGLVPRHCDSTAQWVMESVCPFVCGGEGVCSGQCAPTSKDCQGLTPRTCDSNGSWTSGSACGFVCSAGNCGGVCTPGDRDCQGLTPRSCNSSGQWAQETACSFICGGEGVCSGSCSPNAQQCSGQTPQTCNGSGQWTSGSACPFVCNSGSGTCGGVCVPGTKQCSGSLIQTCNASGQWDSATACSAVQGATVACDSGTQACKATCTGSSFDCNSNMADGCEVDVSSDGNNCGVCGHSCCGGACGSGTCGIADPIAGTGAFDVDSQNLYYVTPGSSDGALYKRPLSGGTSTVFATKPSSSQTILTDVATNGQEVAWGVSVTNASANEYTGVFSKSVAGGATTTEYQCYNCTTYPVHLSYDAVNLYWQVDAANTWNSTSATQIFYNALSQNPVPNNPPTVYSNAMNGSNAFAKVSEFVSDGQYLYARLYPEAAYPDETIHKALPTNQFGNNDSTFVNATGVNSSVTSLATDGQYLYYVMYEYSGSPSYPNIGIWKKPLAGGAATQVLAAPFIQNRIATDGTNVYYAELVAGQRRLRKVSVNGGTPTTISTMAANLNRVRVANECLFWSEGTNIHAVAVNP